MIWRSVALFALAVLVFGCGEDSTVTGAGSGDGGAVVVLAKAEGWRDGLGDQSRHPYALLEVAADEETAQEAWDENVPASLPTAEGEPAQPGLYGELDSVDLERKAIVVFSSGESGTCPQWVVDIVTTDDGVDLELGSTGQQDQGCTDDFNPYRLVLAVDRDRLPEPEQLPVERIDVPSESLTDVAGRVVAYS